MPIRHLGSLVPRFKSGDFSLDLATRQPELSALIAEAISIWSAVEHALGEVFLTMLDVKAGPGFVIWDALTGTYAKIGSLEKVAEVQLGAEDYRLFQSALRLYKWNAKQRHKFVHWLRFYCNQIPEMLILADPSAVLEARADFNERARVPAELSFPPDRARRFEGFNLDDWECYDKAELERISERFREVRGCLRQLMLCIMPSVDAELRSEQRAILAARPLIAEELRRLTQQSQTPASRPPAPQ